MKFSLLLIHMCCEFIDSIHEHAWWIEERTWISFLPLRSWSHFFNFFLLCNFFFFAVRYSSFCFFSFFSCSRSFFSFFLLIDLKRNCISKSTKWEMKEKKRKKKKEELEEGKNHEHVSNLVILVISSNDDLSKRPKKFWF